MERAHGGDGAGLPVLATQARRVGERLRLELSLVGPAPSAAEALALLAADGKKMLATVQAADETAGRLARDLAAIKAERAAPAAVVAKADRVLSDAAARRADPALLADAALDRTLADLTRSEELANAHKQQGEKTLTTIDQRLTALEGSLAKRREQLAKAVLDQLRADLPREQALVAAALVRAAEKPLALLAAQAAAGLAANHPDLAKLILGEAPAATPEQERR